MSLRRDLGLLHATAIGLGSALSAGIFVVFGASVEMAGPAVIVSFLLCGIINMATMLSYCELGSAMPRVGGEYVYVKEAFEGFSSFITGWYELFSNMFYAALMVIASGQMLSYLWPINKSIVMIIIVSVFAAINIKGIRESGNAETTLTLTLLAIMLLFITAGFVHGFRQNAFEPFMPHGSLGIVVAVAFIFESYLGAEAIAATQAEIRDPGKTIPRAMILCSVVLMIVYSLVAYVAVGIATPEALGKSSAPLSLVVERTLGTTGVVLVTAGGLIAALTSLNTSIIASSRATLALSRDRYFPKTFSRIHESYSTPHAAVVVCSILILLTAMLADIRFVVYSINFGFLVGFTLVNLALIKLRSSRPLMNRPFKTPLYPLTPIVGIASSVLLLAFFDLNPLAYGFILGLIGLVVYLLRRKARLAPA